AGRPGPRHHLFLARDAPPARPSPAPPRRLRLVERHPHPAPIDVGIGGGCEHSAAPGGRSAGGAKPPARRLRYFAPSWPPFMSPPPPLASPAFGSLAASSWHFFTSFSSITMVSATSFTERPVARYLFTCLQLTAAPPEPAIPRSKPVPITTIPNFMRDPPCA